MIWLNLRFSAILWQMSQLFAITYRNLHFFHDPLSKFSSFSLFFLMLRYFTIFCQMSHFFRDPLTNIAFSHNPLLNIAFLHYPPRFFYDVAKFPFFHDPVSKFEFFAILCRNSVFPRSLALTLYSAKDFWNAFVECWVSLAIVRRNSSLFFSRFFFEIRIFLQRFFVNICIFSVIICRN